MFRALATLSMLLAGLNGFNSAARSNEVPLVQRPWFETRTPHFNIYSCGASQDVFRLAGRLEQFCEAFAMLAGAQALNSPPVAVVAFPGADSLQSFLPLHNGSPASIAGFFKRGSDENLIVLALPESDSKLSELAVIFHEYTHLLFRHNDRVWPLWLDEGMAEVYSRFEVNRARVRIAQPIESYIHHLTHETWMPLPELFAVTHESPEYNESSRQGMFYAQSWLLTQFLMAGDVPAYKARFGNFTRLLREGQPPEQAFTNALGATLPTIDLQLKRYLAAGKFTPIELPLRRDVSSPKALRTRPLTPVEVHFRLGKELLCVDRLDEAEKYFDQAQKLAPASPLPSEGLGLLATERGRHKEALRHFSEALRLRSGSFLAHYMYARARHQLTADAQERFAPLKDEAAIAEIRGKVRTAIKLMPTFAPAHELLGFFEMVQREDLATAERHLQIALQLEPDNTAYLFSLAQAQLQRRDPASARRTLGRLLLPYVEPKIRGHAEEMLKEIDRDFPAK